MACHVSPSIVLSRQFAILGSDASPTGITAWPARPLFSTQHAVWYVSKNLMG